MNRLQKFDGWRLLKKDSVLWICRISLSKIFLSLEPSFILFFILVSPLNLKSQLINASSADDSFSIETLPDSGVHKIMIESKNNILKYFF